MTAVEKVVKAVKAVDSEVVSWAVEKEEAVSWAVEGTDPCTPV